MRYKLTITALIFLIGIATGLSAKDSNPLDEMLLGPSTNTVTLDKNTGQDTLFNDIIRVNYAKKNAKLAMLMSALVPGAGQYYADKSSITKFIFPAIDLAVIGGMIYYNNEAKKKADIYKDYVNDTVQMQFGSITYSGSRYRRDFQTSVQNELIAIHTNDIYDGEFFSLDGNNSQQFYEDIGKYDKFIFGWIDWYMLFAENSYDGGVPDPEPQFVFSLMSPPLSPDDPRINSYQNKWLGNLPLDGSSISYLAPASGLRDEYKKLRKASEDKYRTANYVSFGLALNHIASAIDAIRVANKVNRFYLSKNDIKLHYYASHRNGNITPMLGVNLSF